MSIPNLFSNFDALRGDQLCAGEILVGVHPAQPLVLIQIKGTAVMLAVDGEGLRVLIDNLVKCHDRLLERAVGNGHP